MKKRPDGRYCRKIKINNKFVFFYSSEKTEKQAARDIERQLLEYREKDKNGKTFAAVAAEWSDDHFPELEHNTLKQYRNNACRRIAKGNLCPPTKTTHQKNHRLQTVHPDTSAKTPSSLHDDPSYPTAYPEDSA